MSNHWGYCNPRSRRKRLRILSGRRNTWFSLLSQFVKNPTAQLRKRIEERWMYEDSAAICGDCTKCPCNGTFSSDWAGCAIACLDEQGNAICSDAELHLLLIDYLAEKRVRHPRLKCWRET